MWEAISSFAPKLHPMNMPSGDQFIAHYKNIANPIVSQDFDYEHERQIKVALKEYDMTRSPCHNPSDIKNDILNMNFSLHEVKAAVQSLKNNKSAGADCIPAEFVKACDERFLHEICMILNYLIEWRRFPDAWAEGLRTSVFKAGDKLNPDNYRGITVLPIFEKIFEIMAQRRIEFINDAFDRTDKYNGGFLKGSRCSDNLYILSSLIERQVNLGQSLIVCFIDFSKAFDLINRDILFYKVIKSGLSGRIIDTLRDLYKKTAFRIKHKGKLGPPILQTVGVNQGGNASPTIFREYLSDLRDYLDDFTGVCLADISISDIILLNLLWADDLILVSTTCPGAQKQMDGLELFSEKNQTTVNGIKTKVMVFGKPMDVRITFKGQPIEQVAQYKYLGNIARAISRPSGDIFGNNYEYLCGKARAAIFAISKRLRQVGPLPPATMMYLYQACVQPILTYGSDVWGTSKTGRDAVDKVLLWFIRYVLRVKSTTSNIITLGECGQIPPGVFCELNCIMYFLRLRNLPESSITNIVFREQQRLHNLGFTTWYGKVWELARTHGLDLSRNYSKKQVKETVINTFKCKWLDALQNISGNPLLRTYAMLKHEYCLEPYLYKVKNPVYRIALSKFRASSHTLEIERGRYTKPKTPESSRLCHHCKCIEDELHFLVACSLYTEERAALLQRVSLIHPEILNLDERGIFLFLLKSSNADVLTLTGKFIHIAFAKREKIAGGEEGRGSGGDGGPVHLTPRQNATEHGGTQ